MTILAQFSLYWPFLTVFDQFSPFLFYVFDRIDCFWLLWTFFKNLFDWFWPFLYEWIPLEPLLSKLTPRPWFVSLGPCSFLGIHIIAVLSHVCQGQKCANLKDVQIELKCVIYSMVTQAGKINWISAKTFYILILRSVNKYVALLT